MNKDGTQRIPKFEKTYCSRSCANGHKHTEETKKKMSKSLTGNIPWNKGKYFKLKIPKFCKKCGIKIGSDNQYGLCNVCVRSKKEIRNKISKTIKEQYKNGKKVFGGKTKWLKYKDFKVQGTYELRACFILDEMLERKEINNWEYTNDRIKYIGEDEKEHYYLLDFKINNDYYIETKGYTSKKDILKWKEAENQNIKIVKWFLEDIEKEEDRLSIIHGVGSVNG